MQLGYAHLPESGPLNETIEITDLKVHIVGSLEVYDAHKGRTDDARHAAGDRGIAHELWVVGKLSRGRIIVNQVILGHELKHLLQLHNPDVMSPFKLETFEACIMSRKPEECK